MRLLRLALPPRIGRIEKLQVLEAGLVCVLSLLGLIHEWGWGVLAIGAILGLLCSSVWTIVVVAAEWAPARPRSRLDSVAIRRTWMTAALVSLALVELWHRLGSASRSSA
jgi:hypothetical protein